MSPQAVVVAVRGPYTLFSGKLSSDDSRTHFVKGPCIDGRIAPIASFHNVDDGYRWLKGVDVEDRCKPAVVPA